MPEGVLTYMIHDKLDIGLKVNITTSRDSMTFFINDILKKKKLNLSNSLDKTIKI